MFISNNYDGDRFGGDTEKGPVSGVTFKDIYVIADSEVDMPMSEFIGADETHRLDGIMIKNVYLNGKKLNNISEANITFNEFCELEFN